MPNRISFKNSDINKIFSVFDLKEIIKKRLTQRGSILIVRKKNREKTVVKIASKSISKTEDKIQPPRSLGLLNEIKILKEISGSAFAPKLDNSINEDSIVASSVVFIQGKSLFFVSGKHKEQVIKELLRVVKELHLLGFVHGDIQPNNFIFNRKHISSINLIDYELSVKIKNKEKLYPAKSEYLSPEAASDALQYGLIKDAVSQDIYALGVTILSMLIGHDAVKFPKNNLSRKEKLEYLSQKKFDYNIKGVNKNFIPLAKKIIEVLSKEIKNRPKSASEFENLIAGFLYNLHSDKLKNDFGNIHPVILRHDSFDEVKNTKSNNRRIREVILSDSKEEAKTYALTFLCNIAFDRKIKIIDNKIKKGGLIGETFRNNGYECRRNIIKNLYINIPLWLKKEFKTKKQKAQARILEFCVKKNDEDIIIYGTIFEVDNPELNKKTTKLNKNEEGVLLDILRKKGLTEEDVWQNINFCRVNKWKHLNEHNIKLLYREFKKYINSR